MRGKNRKIFNVKESPSWAKRRKTNIWKGAGSMLDITGGVNVKRSGRSRDTEAFYKDSVNIGKDLEYALSNLRVKTGVPNGRHSKEGRFERKQYTLRP